MVKAHLAELPNGLVASLVRPAYVPLCIVPVMATVLILSRCSVLAGWARRPTTGLPVLLRDADWHNSVLNLAWFHW